MEDSEECAGSNSPKNPSEAVADTASTVWETSVHYNISLLRGTGGDAVNIAQSPTIAGAGLAFTFLGILDD